jgi:response regulator receiver domain-containing protein
MRRARRLTEGARGCEPFLRLLGFLDFVSQAATSARCRPSARLSTNPRSAVACSGNTLGVERHRFLSVRMPSKARPSWGDREELRVPDEAVLIVEDDREIVGLMRDFLELEGFAVLAVDNGDEALATLTAGPIACVLLDIMLPAESGFEICRRILYCPRCRITNPRASSRRRAAKTEPSRTCRARAVGRG